MMPCWFYDKAELIDTPSFKEGIETEREARYRREGAGFLFGFGKTLGLRSDTMATGAVFFHRFYMFHSFNEFPRYLMATCCLFLAGKVEETPKKCRDIVHRAKTYLEGLALENLNYKKHADLFTDECIKEIMTYEKILLQTIKFDLQVDHPYTYLVKYAKTFNGNKEKLNDLVQRTWTFINDSYCTVLCLQWEPEIIAIALMHLTITKDKIDISNWIVKDSIKQNWWDQFVLDLDISIIEDICHQVLDLYVPQPEQKSQPVQAVKARPVQNGVQAPTANKRVNFSTCGPTSSSLSKSPPDTLSLTPTLNSVGYNEPVSPTSAKLMKTLSEPTQQYQGYQITMNQSYYHESFNPHFSVYAQPPPPPPPPGQPMVPPPYYGYYPPGNPSMMPSQYPPPPPPGHFPPGNKPYHHMPPNPQFDSMTHSYHQFNGHKEQSHVNINGNKMYNSTSSATNSATNQIRSSALKTVSITDRPV